MPCLEISMPKQNSDIKQKLAEALSSDFVKYSGLALESFGIRFNEYDTADSANAGRLWNGQTGKPYMHFKLYSATFSESQKDSMCKAFTESFARCLGRDDWAPAVFFIELPEDSIAFSGKLLAEHKRDWEK